MKKMPKFIDPTLCRPCGKCSLGCPQNAKWTAQEFVREASEYGAKILKDREVTEIIHYKGVVKGVKCGSKEYFADKVILCAGAIETPRLLQKADINAGENLFVDTFVTVGGVLKDINFYQEISMYSLIEKNDIILAPHYSGLLLNPLRKYGATENDILGMMIKIKDENSGQVLQDKAIKYNTSHDTSLIASGASMAGAILSECGVNPNTLVSTPSRGAHPGGTAPIGKVVDINLETEIEGLFVADASVLPCAPGAPPIITILALSKRLAKYLATIQV
jgi:choline dehydrogenase-like flavoprotein